MGIGSDSMRACSDKIHLLEEQQRSGGLLFLNSL
jgi:hypothetical protein